MLPKALEMLIPEHAQHIFFNEPKEGESWTEKQSFLIESLIEAGLYPSEVLYLAVFSRSNKFLGDSVKTLEHVKTTYSNILDRVAGYSNEVTTQEEK